MSFEDKIEISSKLKKNLDLVQQAYDKHDYVQAIYHLRSAIVLEPVNQKAQTILKNILDNNLVDITNLSIGDKSERSQIGMDAIKTFVLGYTKKYDQALLNLTNLLLSTEETLFLYWLEDWLSHEDFFKILSLNALKKALVKLMTLPNQAEFNYSIREIYEFFLNLMMKAEKQYDFDESLTYIMAVISRRCLQFQRSILIAARSYGNKPSYFNTLALAYAYRELKDYDNTVRFFQEAVNFKPDNIEVKLELADYICEKANLRSDDYKRGVNLYKEVADSNPPHSWAYPSYLYYSYMIEFKPSLLEKLEQYCNENPVNERATKLLNKIKSLQGVSE